MGVVGLNQRLPTFIFETSVRLTRRNANDFRRTFAIFLDELCVIRSRTNDHHRRHKRKQDDNQDPPIPRKRLDHTPIREI